MRQQAANGGHGQSQARKSRAEFTQTKHSKNQQNVHTTIQTGQQIVGQLMVWAIKF